MLLEITGFNFIVTLSLEMTFHGSDRMNGEAIRSSDEGF